MPIDPITGFLIGLALVLYGPRLGELFEMWRRPRRRSPKFTLLNPNDLPENPMSRYEETLEVQLLSDTALTPTPGSSQSAGLDLYADETKIIQPGERALVATNIAVRVPMGTYGRVAPRSGLALKQGIDVLAGVIDADYTGPVGVVLINHGSGPVEVKQGGRIAQLIVERISHPEIKIVEALQSSSRGAGGFGSTGQ